MPCEHLFADTFLHHFSFSQRRCPFLLAEEARIKREEAERKGKIVISVTVLNDETEEVMAKASLRLGCKVQELGQVCIREAHLSVAPAIYSEPKPEPKMVRGKVELRERFPLAPDDTLLEAGVENNAVLRAKISSAVITASKAPGCSRRHPMP
eukprot:Skav231542  [mRNA]  locus=scaffold84:740828:742977:- [translate_table: standard]